tara:strand:+ start:69303 stop:70007 length:705 start_codon:yes stop_codon:yes gene_type:complete
MLHYFKRWFPARDEVQKPKKAIRQAVSLLRREYDGIPLDKKSVDADPLKQFSKWFAIAVKEIKNDPNAMILGSTSREGQPATRTVLLKGFDEEGFIFYTNYESRKAKDLAENNKVSLTFYWPDLMRQIHIQGVVEKISEEMSDQYFKSRPVGSKLGAWSSKQSSVIESREVLEENLRTIEKKFSGSEIPRPANWGGYRVIPHRFEFWQGRLNRLHDRIVYRFEGTEWVIERLSP